MDLITLQMDVNAQAILLQIIPEHGPDPVLVPRLGKGGSDLLFDLSLDLVAAYPYFGQSGGRNKGGYFGHRQGMDRGRIAELLQPVVLFHLLRRLDDVSDGDPAAGPEEQITGRMHGVGETFANGEGPVDPDGARCDIEPLDGCHRGVGGEQREDCSQRPISCTVVNVALLSMADQ